MTATRLGVSVWVNATAAAQEGCDDGLRELDGAHSVAGTVLGEGSVSARGAMLLPRPTC